MTTNIIDLLEARARTSAAGGNARGPCPPYANRSSQTAGRGPIFCAYRTEADIASGLAGGLGRLDLAAAVLNVAFDEVLSAPMTFSEVRSCNHGMAAVILRALEGSYDVLVVSELRSLGCDLDSAVQLVDVLADAVGQTVYVSTIGFVDTDAVRALWK